MKESKENNKPKKIAPLNPTSYAQMEDGELIELIKEGDERAFAVLIKRYQKSLYSFIFRMLGTPEEAKEIFQETFIRIYKNIHSFNTDSRFSPWAYRIAHNLCIDYLRKSERDILKKQTSPFNEGLGHHSKISEKGEGSHLESPESITYKNQLSKRVQMAVEQLPPKQRAVFVMYQYNNFSYEEIAEALNIPLGTVKSRMHNAIKRLGTLLKPLIAQQNSSDKK